MIRQADVFGTLVPILIALIWLVGAARQSVAAVRRRKTSAAGSGPAADSRYAGVPPAGAPATAQSLARQPALSGPGPPPGRSGLALRPTRATSAPSPPSGDLAPLAGFSAGDSAFGEPAVQADDNARWLLQPFLGARGVAQAVVGAIILEPCAAHKGMGHEPFDW